MIGFGAQCIEIYENGHGKMGFRAHFVFWR